MLKLQELAIELRWELGKQALEEVTQRTAEGRAMELLLPHMKCLALQERRYKSEESPNIGRGGSHFVFLCDC
jgi:hypothetical protein